MCVLLSGVCFIEVEFKFMKFNNASLPLYMDLSHHSHDRCQEVGIDNLVSVYNSGLVS